MRFAVDYADLILRSVDYGNPDAPEQESSAPASERKDSFDDEPEWMQRARHLEREDRLEEAEQLIRDKIPTLHSAITIAELYRGRWLRLRESDSAMAVEARQQAANWAHTYASWATSGGEGTALSRERDDFLSLLGPEPL